MKLWQWSCDFCIVARGKLTTYILTLLAMLAVLPDIIPVYWKWLQPYLSDASQHKLLAALAVIGIWARVRREIKDRRQGSRSNASDTGPPAR